MAVRNFPDDADSFHARRHRFGKPFEMAMLQRVVSESATEAK